ncbi:hypothetical protein WDU94_012466 [Cyamophila willieti]
MVSEVRALPPLVIPGEQDAAAAAWKLWLQRFKLFLSANGCGESGHYANRCRRGRQHNRRVVNLCTREPVSESHNQDVTLSVDSSSYGIGCVLLQDGQPVAFSSRALNSSRKNYAQVEKEMMAILVGCLRFHKYIFHKKVSVETDHKALESLFKKPLSQVPARIQRMMLKIQAYDLDVKYVPGKYLYLADMLSRAPLPLEETSVENDEIIDIDNDVICQVDLVHKNVCFSSEKLAKLKEETDKDTCLSKLKAVFFKKTPNDLWSPGIISSRVADQSRSYRVTDKEGNEYRRNRQHIFSPPPQRYQEPDSIQDSSSHQMDHTQDSPRCSPASPSQEFHSVESSPSSDQETTGNQVVTRVGRIVRKPKRLIDEFQQ